MLEICYMFCFYFLTIIVHIIKCRISSFLGGEKKHSFSYTFCIQKENEIILLSMWFDKLFFVHKHHAPVINIKNFSKALIIQILFPELNGLYFNKNFSKHCYSFHLTLLNKSNLYNKVIYGRFASPVNVTYHTVALI